MDVRPGSRPEWFRVSATAAPGRSAATSFLLDLAGIPFQVAGRSGELVTVFASGEEGLAQVTGLLSQAGCVEVQVEPYVDDPDAWVERWKEFYQWTRVSDRLAVGPDFKPCPFPVAHPIRIHPGRAFGTGCHESTRIALQLLDERLRPGDLVCDVGCGSGVLAIAARLLGAGPVVALDFDEQACRETRENAALNQVSFEVQQGNAERLSGSYDLVLANLLGHVLVRFAGRVKDAVRPGGHLVLSGLIAEEKGTFAQEFFGDGSGFAALKVVTFGDWWGGSWRRGQP